MNFFSSWLLSHFLKCPTQHAVTFTAEAPFRRLLFTPQMRCLDQRKLHFYATSSSKWVFKNDPNLILMNWAERGNILRQALFSRMSQRSLGVMKGEARLHHLAPELQLENTTCWWIIWAMKFLDIDFRWVLQFRLLVPARVRRAYCPT